MPSLTFSNELISRRRGYAHRLRMLAIQPPSNVARTPTPSNALLPATPSPSDKNSSQVCNIVYFVDDALSNYLVDALPCKLIGMNSDLMCQYIEFVADRLLVSLGNEKVYNVS